jgi:hypothetical protein
MLVVNRDVKYDMIPVLGWLGEKEMYKLVFFECAVQTHIGGYMINSNEKSSIEKCASAYLGPDVVRKYSTYYMNYIQASSIDSIRQDIPALMQEWLSHAKDIVKGLVSDIVSSLVKNKQFADAIVSWYSKSGSTNLIPLGSVWLEIAGGNVSFKIVDSTITEFTIEPLIITVHHILTPNIDDTTINTYTSLLQVLNKYSDFLTFQRKIF